MQQIKIFRGKNYEENANAFLREIQDNYILSIKATDNSIVVIYKDLKREVIQEIVDDYEKINK